MIEEGIVTGFCSKPNCVKNATHVLYHFPGDGFKYSIRHCKKHLEWAREIMDKFIEENDQTTSKT